MAFSQDFKDDCEKLLPDNELLQAAVEFEEFPMVLTQLRQSYRGFEEDIQRAYENPKISTSALAEMGFQRAGIFELYQEASRIWQESFQHRCVEMVGRHNEIAARLTKGDYHGIADLLEEAQREAIQKSQSEKREEEIPKHTRRSLELQDLLTEAMAIQAERSRAKVSLGL